ncbi:1-deoxy-D-xylulose-5-phosphate reductoisomerase [Zhengella mangrovi]|uniref:1-deoxy-D-xylulose 5-phosphate reductoisomerase n=1 Tax=Zhengella mangrovi TaxID=1982044 RepID=A0A2G1QSF2_9HYPH|nr:1-deoxy-D-xylulose-5-phosphate reductoisomerase [Zhengella mangrovi]PHP68466.1 1-deoxy-D-xylulose-5-phosphate reductoisomerase [Zhengella mangrovi]
MTPDPSAISHRRISVLGATGSIGVNTLDVIAHMGGPEAFDVVALTGASNVALLAEQAKAVNAEVAVTADERRYHDLKAALAGTGIEAAAGRGALIEAAGRPADITMAAIVGMAGLEPTLAAAANGGVMALANKECLVSAGDLFIAAVREAGGTLLPVDSEHNAIFQVLDPAQKRAVERIILTASGGPFRTFTREQMAGVTAETARRHPNWSMGLKISIDSASMFNKALEMVEARHLFNVAPDQVEVIVHPQSIVHSMVAYADGSVLAQLGPSDMRTAIGYCLAWPFRAHMPVERLDFAKLAQLDFEAPDEARFPALRLARQALAHAGVAGAVLNGAKEVALDAFIDGRLGFLAMAETVERVMEAMATWPSAASLADVIAADAEARERARALL